MLTGMILSLVVLAVIGWMFNWVCKSVVDKEAHRPDPQLLFANAIDYFTKVNAGKKNA